MCDASGLLVATECADEDDKSSRCRGREYRGNVSIWRVHIGQHAAVKYVHIVVIESSTFQRYPQAYPVPCVERLVAYSTVRLSPF